MFADSRLEHRLVTKFGEGRRAVDEADQTMASLQGVLYMARGAQQPTIEPRG